MFYFWSSGEKGEIWLSGDGIREAFVRMHPDLPGCSDVVLLGEKNLLSATFVLEPGTPPVLKTDAEKRFLEFARKIGIEEIQVGWVKERSTEETISTRNLIQSPLAWGMFFWIATAVFRMGFSGTILATIAALAAFSISGLFTTQQGLEIRKWMKSLFVRNI